ncbi:MAG: hypothetical protein EOO07_22305, partial [Chitinophagaceae bacterium]
MKHILFTFNFIFISSLLFGQSRLVRELTPDFVNLQYGGSIGYVSGGIGYFFFNHKTTASVNYGFVPASKGGELNILTTKFDYKPFNIKLGKEVTWQPINPVFFVSYTLGRDFDKKFDPDQYPEGYYWWSTALKGHLGISTELKLLGNGKATIKAVSLYAETNT